MLVAIFLIHLEMELYNNIMDEKYSNMSNADLKLAIETLTNEFDAKKNQLIKICEEMDEVEKKYLAVKHELDNRKNLFI